MEEILKTLIQQLPHIKDKLIIINPEHSPAVLMCDDIDFPIVVTDKCPFDRVIIMSERDYDLNRLMNHG